MSRPIFSRPRTRVYGCNYDKGESYYKPMVDHLDRKYSGRPLFPEPRTSFADEIAARRSDIGSRDLSGPRSSFARDLDLEFDTPRLSRSTQAQNLYEDDEDTVYDIRGQRTNRRNLADDFASEVASTTRRIKSQTANLSKDMEHYDELRQRRTEVTDKFIESAKTAIDDADAAFKRRSLLFNEDGERNTNMTKWSMFKDAEADLSASSAASRAKQTKARLNDLETEMEEMAERQAKRERRAAALRAMVHDASTEDDYHQEITAKKLTVKSTERAEKHVNF